MKTKNTGKLAFLLAGTLLGGAVASAQQTRVEAPKAPRPDGNVMIFTSEAPPPMGGPMQDTFRFVGMEGGFGHKVVKGAPYSAESVTETVQTLSDGNRIVRSNKASVYRDTEGRTRREQSLGAIGPWATAEEPARFVTIQDPVTGFTYTLNPRNRTATKMAVPAPGNGGFRVMVDKESGPQNAPAPMAGEGGPVRIQIERRINGDGPPPPLPEPPPGAIVHQEIRIIGGPDGTVNAPANDKRPHPDMKKEDLGTQTIEGVSAQGTRHTTTFPAGFFGNERPLQIVDEKWYSTELQTVIMTKHSDPRSGETTFRLTNVNRSNPDKALFEVPGDYKVTEPRMERREMKMRKENP